ncbi:MAG: hypothetical protein V4864_11950 [Pseudomonadota bacterium]
MSFLNQLKSQAKAVQGQREQQDSQLEERVARTEAACDVVLSYFKDLARQLNVLQPPAPAFSLDGRTPWPAMKLVDFRVDARRKSVRGRDAFDYIAMGWNIVPQTGEPVGGVVSVNFPPDLQRVESRLAMGPVKHERQEVRDPAKNVLRAVRFDYLTQTRGSVNVAAEHEDGQLAFRLLNTSGFEIVNLRWPAQQVNQALLDELAKRIVSEPSRFA